MRWLWVPILVLFSYLTIAAAVDGEVLPAVGYGVVGLVLTLWLSPFQGRRSSQADVLALPDGDRGVVIYWRPSCVYCLRLRTALGRAGGRALWVNIWEDADAAAYVRSVNGGNETVPTVLIDGTPHTNPDPSLVRQALTGQRS